MKVYSKFTDNLNKDWTFFLITNSCNPKFGQGVVFIVEQ